MVVYGIGLGGAGGIIVANLLEEIKQKGIERVNLDYTLIDFSEGVKGVEKLMEDKGFESKIDIKKCIYLDRPSTDWITANFSRFDLKWIPKNPERGTGRNRSYSRIVFEWNKKRIKEGIKGASRGFAQRKSEKTISFWLFTSFGGGTGSGMFIDIALLLNEIKKELSVEKYGVSILGVGVLPSASTKGDDALSPPNAIQAFKELDYLISMKAKEEVGIDNPFDVIFLLGLHSLMTEPEISRLKIDKVIANSILDFCYAKGIDFNDILSEINRAVTNERKYLAFSQSRYYFPLDRLEERKNDEEEVFKLTKEKADLDIGIATLESQIRDINSTINTLQESINDLNNKIAEEEKNKTPIVGGMKIKGWQKKIDKELTPQKEKLTEVKNKLERDMSQKTAERDRMDKRIKYLDDSIATIKTDLMKIRENEIIFQESITEHEYSIIKDNLTDLKAKSLKDIVNEVKGEDAFDKILVNRLRFLTDWSPIIIGIKEEKIPLLELGYASPEEGVIDDTDIKQHSPATVDDCIPRQISAPSK